MAVTTGLSQFFFLIWMLILSPADADILKVSHKTSSHVKHVIVFKQKEMSLFFKPAARRGIPLPTMFRAMKKNEMGEVYLILGAGGKRKEVDLSKAQNVLKPLSNKFSRTVTIDQNKIEIDFDPDKKTFVLKDLNKRDIYEANWSDTALERDEKSGLILSLLSEAGIALESAAFSYSLILAEAAQKCARKTDDVNSQVLCHEQLAEIYTAVRNVQKSLSNAVKGLELLNSDPRIKEAKRIESYLLCSIGDNYKALGNYPEALKYYNTALEFSQKQSMKNLTMTLFDRIGNVYWDLGDHDKALEFFNSAVNLADKGRYDDKRRMAYTFINIGNVYRSLGNYGEAITYYNKSSVLSEKLKIRFSRAKAELNIGDILLKSGKNEEALKIYNKYREPVRTGYYYLLNKDYSAALEYFKKSVNDKTLRQDKKNLIDIYIGLGLTEENLGHPSLACKYFGKAVDAIEDERKRLTHSQKRFFFRGGEIFPRIEAYEGLVRCSYSTGDLNNAFVYSENTKSRLLLDLISGRYRNGHFNLPKDLAERESQLTAAVISNNYSRDMSRKKDNQKELSVLKNESTRLNNEMEIFVSELEKRYPRYAAVKYPRPVNASRIPLKDKETLIEYEVTGPYTLGFAVKSGKILAVFKIEKTRDELEKLVSTFRAPFDKSESQGEHFVPAAMTLFDLLIKPVRDLIPSDNSVVIVPDECLSVLPFEALVVSKGKPKGDSSNVTSTKFFMDQHPVKYLQSSSLLYLRHELKTNKYSDPSFLGIGDCIFCSEASKHTHRIPDMRGIMPVSVSQLISNNSTTKQAGFRFAQLPNTRKEVESIGQRFSGKKILLGDDANEANLKSLNLESYRFILFSTHSVLGNQLPYIKEPAIVLNLVGNTSEDGFLTAGEVFDLKLNADLVTLSACQTGLGLRVAGDGILGLSRAFSYAGAESIISSLWNVSDESTCLLMVKFFDEINLGFSKVIALQRAKAYIRKKGWDHPFYWAPFILLGE